MVGSLEGLELQPRFVFMSLPSPDWGLVSMGPKPYVLRFWHDEVMELRFLSTVF